MLQYIFVSCQINNQRKEAVHYYHNHCRTAKSSFVVVLYKNSQSNQNRRLKSVWKSNQHPMTILVRFSQWLYIYMFVTAMSKAFFFCDSCCVFTSRVSYESYMMIVSEFIVMFVGRAGTARSEWNSRTSGLFWEKRSKGSTDTPSTPNTPLILLTTAETCSHFSILHRVAEDIGAITWVLKNSYLWWFNTRDFTFIQFNWSKNIVVVFLFLVSEQTIDNRDQYETRKCRPFIVLMALIKIDSFDQSQM